MTELKYSKPLEYYTVDNFIAECRKLVGKPVHGVFSTPSYESAGMPYMIGFALALGDSNDLHTDLTYAVSTKYHILIAPPTFLVAFKYPISYGVLFDGPYPLAGFEAEFNWEWHDVIRMNDRFTSELILKDVYERSDKQSRIVYLVSECKYWNQLKELVASCRGTYVAIARAGRITEIPGAVKEGFRKQLIIDREVYHYSEEEVARIVKDVKGEVVRGSKPRYWEDIDVGDKLPPVVKGPLTSADLLHYATMIFSSNTIPGFEIRYRKGLKTPRFLRTNTLMGWPYDIQLDAHLDPNMSGTEGMPTTFALGTLKVGLYTHLLSNWMGDDGFIRRLDVDVSEPYIYGDCLWIRGEVVEKYKEKRDGVLYRAVDVKLEAVNQLGATVHPGTATVYLPSPGHEVGLPIPH